eukprot:TRINITY_DN37048_c0_g1_i1.p1 TRINITY_DN37048_c0_g1~~TRINITY_DN37048_c0_g1_i1.p1  ORF type:complete len:171 (+),score=41.15 TRINITY_DN37048_c0_g1_i1:61-573(+)
MWTQLTGVLLMACGAAGQAIAVYNEAPISNDVSKSFDYEGWCTCPDGYAMTAMRRSDCNMLLCIEEFKCARPQGSTGYKNCQDYSISSSFDHQGWVDCPDNHFITGFWRTAGNGCNGLHCIETMKCCEFDFPTATTTGCQGDTDWASCFDSPNTCSVPDNRFLTGLYRDA